MSVQMGSNRFPIDALTILAGAGNTPAVLTSTGATTGFISLDVLTSYWATGDIAEELDMAVVIVTTAVAGTSVTVTPAVQVAPDSGAFATPVTIGTGQAITAAGQSVVVVDREQLINALGASQTVASLRVNFTIAGTSPSFSYVAYVAPLTGL